MSNLTKINIRVYRVTCRLYTNYQHWFHSQSSLRSMSIFILLFHKINVGQNDQTYCPDRN